MARNIAFFAEIVFFPQIDVEMTTTEIQRSLGYLINSFIYTIPLSIIIFYKNKI